MRTLLVLALTPAVVAFAQAATDDPATLIGNAPLPPVADREPVTDVYHRVTVTDDYRWLEDWSDDRVKAWSDRQNAYARGYLDALPSRDAIERRLTELLSAPITRYGDLHAVGGRLFAIKTQPPKEQPFLVVMDSAGAPDTARTLVDPANLDAAGTTTIDWYVPSPDGSVVAVSLSSKGTESGDLHFFDVATGERIHEVIERVNGGTAGGSLAWTPDGDAVLYTRYPRTGERPEDEMAFYVHVYRHTLGTDPAEDTYELGHGLPKIAEFELKAHHDTGRFIATVQDGDGGDFAHFVRQPDGTWHRVSWFKNGIKQAYFGSDGTVYLINRKNAPRGEVLTLDPATPDASNARLFIAEGEDTVVSNFWSAPSITTIGDTVLVEYQTGGPSEIRAFNAAGEPIEGPRQLPVSSVGAMIPITSADGSRQLLFSNGSFTELTGWYRWDPDAGTTTPTALNTEPPADLSDVTVLREFATSKDGTKVPVNILVPPGVSRSGDNPVVINGYGGYGISLTPYYRTNVADLLEQGVIYCVVNLRGGGEFGSDWHRQGNLTNKQNVFDDFQAAIEHMIDRGYTNPDKVGIIGGSNGGLLMGATFTQRPDLTACVVSYVGIYDMLRVELSANGVFNIPEFGTVTNPDHFRAMHAYSPYHNVRDGVTYPPILFLTGANDPRVDPMQSRKMTARLQATGTPNPVLLRTSMDSGHGGGTALSERIAQTVDVHAFIYDSLGVEYTADNGNP